MTTAEALDRFMNPSTRRALMAELQDEVDDLLADGARCRRDEAHAERLIALADITLALNRAVDAPDLQRQSS